MFKLSKFKEMHKYFTAKTAFYAGLVFLVLAFSFGSFVYGYSLGSENPKIITVSDITNIDGDSRTKLDFGVFWESWDLLKKGHLKGEEVKDQDFLYGAVRGLVNSLDDPHTVFFPPEDSKKFEEDVNGNFGGIGAEIGIKDKQLVVIAPLKNTPAEKAGLKAGDKILEIDGKIAEGWDVNQAVKKIRGEIGTEVALTVFRDGFSAPKDIKITRANIEIPTIESKVIKQSNSATSTADAAGGIVGLGDKKISVISLFAFNQNAPREFYKEVLRALIGGSDGIVIDLRNNPGGYLEVAIDLAGWFLDKGDLVVTERFRSGQENIFRANGNEALKNTPVVVLINKGSASASEILAGALRAKRGIKLVGAQTFGKGTVQELRSLSDGSKIKLTIANWVLPDGTIIDEKGLLPDFEVEIKDEDIAAKKDTQLDKAIEVLLSEMK